MPRAHCQKLVFALLLLLTACANVPNKAPIEEPFAIPSRRLDYHIVAAGDTVFSIAWSYGIDYRKLASTNNLAPPYTLAVGQKLRLPTAADGAAATANQWRGAAADIRTSRIDERRKGAHSGAVKPTNRVDRLCAAGGIVKVLEGWRWPANGAVGDRYGARSSQHKGIDIRGELGEPVYAANSGKVVYAGSGLVGYGNLLIIKHSDQFLSAYAHNNRLLVNEGQVVKAGEQVAEIGDSGTDSVKLYFEIRCDGEPIDPLRVLPSR